MLNQFRIRYPQGSLVSDLVEIDREKYIVRTLIQNEGVTLATGLAAATTVEQAEDRARERALAALSLSVTDVSVTAPTTHSTAELVSAKPDANRNGDFDSQNARPQTKSHQNQVPAAYEPDTPPSESTVVSESEPVSPAPDVPAEKPPSEFSPEPTQQPLDYSTPDEYSGFSFEQEREPLAETSAPSAQWTSTAPEPGNSSLSGPIDFSDIIAKTNVEMKRLGWTSEQGRRYLLETYGKRSRQLLSDEELLDFLNHLESL